MSDLSCLIARASAYGLLLSAQGPHLRVESVTGAPVPTDFRDELVAARDGLLTHLRWRDQAIEALCAAMRRLEGSYPIGYLMDEPDWREVDAAITDAYWRGDLAELRRAVTQYELFAMQRFELYRASLERHDDARHTTQGGQDR